MVARSHSQVTKQYSCYMDMYKILSVSVFGISLSKYVQMTIAALQCNHSLVLLANVTSTLGQLALQLCLWGAADAILPQDGSVVHECEPQLGLQVKVLPVAGTHRRMEHIGYV